VFAITVVSLVISVGTGVFPRSEKLIQISTGPAMRQTIALPLFLKRKINQHLNLPQMLTKRQTGT
jgi:hypothetical protein